MTNVTKATTITVDIKLWAVPKNAWDVSTVEPERFEVRAYTDGQTPYQDGAVALPVSEVVKLEAPAYDCTAEGIQALEAAKAEALVEHAIALKVLDNKIAELTCLVQLDT